MSARIYRQAEQYPVDPEWPGPRSSEEIKDRANPETPYRGGHGSGTIGIQPKSPKSWGPDPVEIELGRGQKIMHPHETGLEHPVVVGRSPDGRGYDIVKHLE